MTIPTLFQFSSCKVLLEMSSVPHVVQIALQFSHYKYMGNIICCGGNRKYEPYDKNFKLGRETAIQKSCLNFSVNLSLAEHDMSCLSKQCRSRSVGF